MNQKSIFDLVMEKIDKCNRDYNIHETKKQAI